VGAAANPPTCSAQSQGEAGGYFIHQALISACVAPNLVAERLGHDTTETTFKHYLHAAPGGQAIAAAEMEKILSGQRWGRPEAANSPASQRHGAVGASQASVARGRLPAAVTEGVLHS
jgi:hypothetical protein